MGSQQRSQTIVRRWPLCPIGRASAPRRPQRSQRNRGPNDGTGMSSGYSLTLRIRWAAARMAPDGECAHAVFAHVSGGHGDQCLWSGLDPRADICPYRTTSQRAIRVDCAISATSPIHPQIHTVMLQCCERHRSATFFCFFPRPLRQQCVLSCHIELKPNGKTPTVIFGGGWGWQSLSGGRIKILPPVE